MSNGFQLKYLWHDNDCREYEASASNGEFAGRVKAYISIGDLAKAAATLEGFPRNLSDTREFQFGAFGRESAGGGLRLRFFCKDPSGHAAVEFRFESEGESNTGSKWNLPEQTANFFGEIEAHAVDEFVVALRQLEETIHGTAWLRFTDS